MKKIVRTRQEELDATRPNIHRNKKKYKRTDKKNKTIEDSLYKDWPL